MAAVDAQYNGLLKTLLLIASATLPVPKRKVNVPTLFVDCDLDTLLELWN